MILSLLLLTITSLPLSTGTPTSTKTTFPTIFLVSDSTAVDYDPATSPIQGFGYYLPNFLHPTVNLTNRSRGGRSTRSFINEGLWSTLLSLLTPSSTVLIEFGHNDDGGTPGTGSDIGKDRATLPGIGPETILVTNSTGLNETVRTFGSYLRQMVHDVRNIGATPILSGMVPIMHFDNATGELQKDWPFNDYAREVARMEDVGFVEHTAFAVRRWQQTGEVEALVHYPLNDSTHTDAFGANVNAEAFVTAVDCVGPSFLKGFLNSKAGGLREFC